MMLQADEVFGKEYGTATNFMTPSIRWRKKLGTHRAVELSHGRGLNHEPIFGVTVVDVNNEGETSRRCDLSKVFWSESEAVTYIDSLSIRNGHE